MRRSRPTLLGVFMALIAVFGLVCLSSWHSADFHDDRASRTVLLDHDHGSARGSDQDAPIHELAHATSEWISAAVPAPTPPVFRGAAMLWSVAPSGLRAGIDPSGPLRPPRG